VAPFGSMGYRLASRGTHPPRKADASPAVSVSNDVGADPVETERGDRVGDHPDR